MTCIKAQSSKLKSQYQNPSPFTSCQGDKIQKLKEFNARDSEPHNVISRSEISTPCSATWEYSTCTRSSYSYLARAALERHIWGNPGMGLLQLQPSYQGSPDAVCPGDTPHPSPHPLQLQLAFQSFLAQALYTRNAPTQGHIFKIRRGGCLA